MLLYSLLLEKTKNNVSDKIKHLTTQGYRDVILKRDEADTYLVLFTGYHPSLLKRVKKSVKEFHKVVNLIGDAVHYAMINLTEEPFLSSRLGINSVPHLEIYYPSGSDTFRGKFSAPNIVDFVSEKLPNYVRPFDRKWLDDETPSVVLFTDQIHVPTLWSSLSMKFREDFIRFGICSEFHIHSEFQISRLPTILFFNKSSQIRYRDNYDEISLFNSISAFINGTLVINDTIDDEGFYKLNEFDSQCNGHELCVLYIGSDISSEYRQIRVMSRRNALKFFYGSEGIPIDGMKENMFYIWNPRRKAIIVVKSIEELAGTLDRVIDGGARWTKLADFQKQYEL